jgi:hypothetical protein
MILANGAKVRAFAQKLPDSLRANVASDEGRHTPRHARRQVACKTK